MGPLAAIALVCLIALTGQATATPPPAKLGHPTPAAEAKAGAKPSAAPKTQPKAVPPKPSISKSSVKSGTAASGKPQMTMAIFLDRLMLAESGGRDDARNPRSTAVGPYQFIEATFIDVARRHFAKDVEKLDDAALLALRTNRAFARRVAEAFTRDNAAHLAAAGIKPTYPNLRLAFLLGAGGAVSILRAKPDTRLTALLPPVVIRANPFMARLTAKGLVLRAARDIAATPAMTASVTPGMVPPARGKRRPARPAIRVKCNLARASCRRWLALQKGKRHNRSKRTRLSRR